MLKNLPFFLCLTFVWSACATAPSGATASGGRASPILAQPLICIEARSDERRHELLFLTRLVFAHLSLSEPQAPQEPRVVQTDSCESREFNLAVILPNQRWFSNAMRKSMQFRRPQMRCIAKENRCVSDYGPLFHLDTADDQKQLVLNPFISWRLVDQPLRDLFERYAKAKDLGQLRSLADELQKRRFETSGDGSLSAINEVLRASDFEGELPYTPSLALYPVLLHALASPAVQALNLSQKAPGSYFIDAKTSQSCAPQKHPGQLAALPAACH